jgi:hypothetical protein
MEAGKVLRKYAGQWVAWNREQDRVISSGRTFDEAKQAAAAAGEPAVILSKASPADSQHPHWLCSVAVFIAVGPQDAHPWRRTLAGTSME